MYTGVPLLWKAKTFNQTLYNQSHATGPEPSSFCPHWIWQELPWTVCLSRCVFQYSRNVSIISVSAVWMNQPRIIAVFIYPWLCGSMVCFGPSGQLGCSCQDQLVGNEGSQMALLESLTVYTVGWASYWLHRVLHSHRGQPGRLMCGKRPRRLEQKLSLEAWAQYCIQSLLWHLLKPALIHSLGKEAPAPDGERCPRKGLDSGLGEVIGSILASQPCKFTCNHDKPHYSFKRNMNL